MLRDAAPPAYSPLAARVPEGAGVARSYPGLGLGPAELARCDRDTVFCDMFAVADGRELLCIGPPWEEFGPPLAVAVDGRSQAFRVEVPTEFEMRRAALLRVALDAAQAGVVEVRVAFARFAVARAVDLDAGLPWRLPRVALTLATVQKDNPLTWLRDWCLWHRRAHGFDRVVIYDNGSRDAEDIYARLAAAVAPDGLELVVVRWDFPYGPPHPFTANFAQTVALNHCRLRFGAATRWCVNLDVDEYLYNASDRTVEACLAAAAPAGIAFLPQYRVPFAGAEARCFGSTRRNARLDPHGAPKVAYRSSAIRWNEVHGAAPERLTLWSRVKGRAIVALRGAPAPVRRAFSAFVRARRRRRVQASEPALFFYHFESLNTGWKTPRTAAPADTPGLVDDPRIAAMATVVDH